MHCRSVTLPILLHPARNSRSSEPPWVYVVLPAMETRKVIWQVCEQRGRWRDFYPAELNLQVEEAFRVDEQGGVHYVWRSGDNATQYTIDFLRRVQTNDATGYTREIRRAIITDE